MKRIISIVALAAATSASAQTHLTLQEALGRALQVNNTIERSRAEVGVQEENRRYLLSQVLPHVSATGSAIRNSEEVSFGSGSDARIILPGNDWNYRVVLSQPVYAGNRERRAYEQAKLGIANAQQGVAGTEDAVLLRVASNYLNVVNADALIDVERRNIELAQKRRAQAEAFYQAGEVTKVDILRAETSLKAEQRQLAAAQQTRENAVSRLRADLDLEGDIAVDRPAGAAPALPDESSLVARAVDARPDVMVAQNNVKTAELEVRKQRGFWLPTVTFDAGWISQKSAFPASKYGYGAFRFSVPIWQSGEVEARVAQAKDREEQAKLTLEEAKTTAREDVRQAIVDLRAAETSLQLAREQQTAAEAEYAETFERYRAQEATSLDLAASEASLADARRAVASETLNRDLSQLRVWYAAGALKDAVGAKKE
ncbi:MAG TPA: TolC family protein [Thermoanaerobaculia bacterium]